MDVMVLGWYDNGNIGDEAYKLAFPKVFPGVHFNFVSEIKPGHYKNIILGGGDVYNQHYIKQMRQVTGKKWAMSVNCIQKDLVDQTIGMFDKVFFRAHNEDCGTHKKVSVFPDFTFMLQPDRDRGKLLIDQQFRETDSDRYQKVVVVIVNSFLTIKEGLLARDYLTFEKIATDLAGIFDQTNASFLFLPFTNGFPHNDRITNSVVYSRCKYWKKNSLWYKDLPVQDALDICAAADLVVSSRLHGGIFSVIGGTPFIDLTHHSKTVAFLNFIKRPYWSVNYWQFDGERMNTMLKVMLDDAQERASLEKIAIECRRQLQVVPGHVEFQI